MPIVAVAFGLAVLLSGPLISPTPLGADVAHAAGKSGPIDCPGRISTLNFKSGQRNELSDGDIVDLNCTYLKTRKGKQALALGIRARYHVSGVLPSVGPPPSLPYCWLGEDAPGHVVETGLQGQVYPIADRFIWVSYSANNKTLVKKARAAAVRLAKDLVADPSYGVASCPGAESVDASDGEGEALEAALHATAQAYLVLVAEHDLREAEAEVMENAAVSDLDAQSRAMAVRAAAAEAFAAGVESLGLEAELEEATDLVLTARDEARLWTLMAGDLSLEALAQAGFEHSLAAADAAFAATSARENAQAALRGALGLPPSGEPPGGVEGEEAVPS